MKSEEFIDECFKIVYKNEKKTKRYKYNESVNDMIEHCKNTLVNKAKEYQNNDNPFSAFELGAKVINETPEKVLWGYMLKHYTSLQDMVFNDDLKNINKLKEKAGDMINYLLILVAMENSKNE